MIHDDAVTLKSQVTLPLVNLSSFTCSALLKLFVLIILIKLHNVQNLTSASSSPHSAQ